MQINLKEEALQQPRVPVWKMMLQRVQQIVELLEERLEDYSEKIEENDYCDSDRNRFNVIKYLGHKNIRNFNVR